jgi:hypothetical protein
MAVLTKIDMSNLSFLERGMRNCHILSLKSIADVLGMELKILYNLEAKPIVAFLWKKTYPLNSLNF